MLNVGLAPGHRGCHLGEFVVGELTQPSEPSTARGAFRRAMWAMTS